MTRNTEPLDGNGNGRVGVAIRSPAEALLTRDSGSVLAAISEAAGGGRVILSGQDSLSLAGQFADSNQRFCIQALSWLAHEAYWVRLGRFSGGTPSGGSSDVIFTVDPEGLEIGTHEAFLTVKSNDPTQPGVAIPIAMIVEHPLPLALYQTFIDDHFPVGEGNTAPLEDRDSDGISNAVEFFFQENPAAGGGGENLPDLNVHDDSCTLSYTRRGDVLDQLIHFYHSDDHREWNPLTGSVMPLTTNADENGDGTSTVHRTIDLGSVSVGQFFRFEMGLPE
ncbi:MAG: hypothetical protein ACI957_005619 [Verrucomicrobiales bacterium]